MKRSNLFPWWLIAAFLGCFVLMIIAFLQGISGNHESIWEVIGSASFIGIGLVWIAFSFRWKEREPRAVTYFLVIGVFWVIWGVLLMVLSSLSSPLFIIGIGLLLITLVFIRRIILNKIVHSEGRT
jgi:hypothetical protein